jgi:antitoxin Phd
MTVFTFSEARQKFAAILERARREGAVRVKRRDGQVFIIQPDRSRHSPLDVAGVDTDLSAKEIVDMIREMRQHESAAHHGGNLATTIQNAARKKPR